jgi:penicillin-binding protein 1A
VLKGVPEQSLTPPPGIVTARIDAATGLRTEDGALSEFFYQEFVPAERVAAEPPWSAERPPDEIRNQLF